MKAGHRFPIKGFTKMSIAIEQFSYFPQLATLIHLYVELSLPLPAAFRAAHADLSSWPAESSLSVSELVCRNTNEVERFRELGNSWPASNTAAYK
jgi:hypothetical protein